LLLDAAEYVNCEKGMGEMLNGALDREDGRVTVMY
jgi:hypothetical protein